jgi:amidohydrolase
MDASDLTSELRTAVGQAEEALIRDRRELHTYPELAFREHRTTDLIQERMGHLPVEPFSSPTETGAVYVLEGARPGRTVLLRADIDALPIDEQTAVPFRSTVDGCMHACGHDAHAAMLITAAGALASAASSLAGRYAFVFQPAEEALGGARTMVEAGLVEALDADAALACHVASIVPAGVVVTRPGILLSHGVAFRVTITGAGGHGALSGMSGNPLAMAARLAVDLPSVVNGMATEGTTCACTAGVLHSGTACNVTPSEAVVEGTLRTFTQRQRGDALDRLAALVDVLATEYGVDATLTLILEAPAVVNDAAATATLVNAGEEVLGRGRVAVARRPMTPSDDMSEFFRRVPGVFFFLGAALPANGSGAHHTPRFAIDENVLADGALLLAATAARLAAEGTT